MKEIEEKQKSWIEEAWEYSRIPVNTDDLATTIDEYYEYVKSRQ